MSAPVEFQIIFKLKKGWKNEKLLLIAGNLLTFVTVVGLFKERSKH
jgi:hypothetical protein